MKKKNLNLGKLNLKKSSIASLEKTKHHIQGGIANTQFPCNVGSDIINGCIPHTMDNCPPPPTQWPQCGFTDIACNSNYNITECNCVSQDILCEPNDTIQGPTL